MTTHGAYGPEKLPPPAPDYESDAAWRHKPLTPAQVLVHDIAVGKEHLEITEVPSTALVPVEAKFSRSSDLIRAHQAAQNPIEQQRFQLLEDKYGWIKHLRLDPVIPTDTEKPYTQCRWTHVSSKFPEYLASFFWSLSDHDRMGQHLSHGLRAIDESVERYRRYSKHGEYFVPFYEPLLNDQSFETQPVLISCPWTDWGVTGTQPQLRFQVDRREGFRSSRSSAHLLRSILQHWYRLEDTADREKLQVFTKHKPWENNKDLDLRIRRWYGHYPSSLVVDELWILVVDSANIVTFSSNVSWKSRWPPLQLASRVANVSFRQFRRGFGRTWQSEQKEYTSATHAMVCLSGAVGMLHRSFWSDMPLCLTDRFAGYLGHLQYRLHRAPSTKLVMSLISCYDELNIVIQITHQQMDLLISLQEMPNVDLGIGDGISRQRRPRSAADAAQGWNYTTTTLTKYRTNISSSRASSPLLQIIDNLQRELADLEDLRDNTNALITRTIQLVNIRLEDNGKSILVFTVVTIIFLPLNFIASFFGMNVSDIRELDQTQALFWIVAVCVTTGVAALSTFIAFQGSNLMESYKLWRDNRAADQRLISSLKRR
ncbi:hypothetical protein AMS68_005836 [Peltaster fructicola]|uniref:Uncharacterized protein n=1 Tax=Peltaster fructicola TaxID=286661 RepID=A0A6H0Y0C7_9PEZI|nr:hypothetical protein AMS68_005836 [Peltaster fructicola]